MKKYNIQRLVQFFHPVVSSCSTQDFEEEIVFDTEPPAFLHIRQPIWPFGKSKAVCFTWDDGARKHTRYLAKLFSKHGLQATFYLVTKDFKKKSLLREYKFVLRKGHEVGSHTVSHKVLPMLKESEVEYEVGQPVLDIKKQFGFYPTTFAHPKRKMNEMVDNIISKYYLTTRCSSIINYPFRKVHSLTRKDTLKELNQKFDYFMLDERYTWFTYVGHGLSSKKLDTVHTYEPLDAQTMDSFLSYITNRYGEKVFFATYEDVAMYQYLRDRIKLKFGDGVIVFDVSEAQYALDRYSHPRALVSLVFKTNHISFKSKALVDFKVIGKKTIITLDLRKGTTLFYEFE